MMTTNNHDGISLSWGYMTTATPPPQTTKLVLSGPLLSHGMYEYFFLFITNYKQHFIQWLDEFIEEAIWLADNFFFFS